IWICQIPFATWRTARALFGSSRTFHCDAKPDDARIRILRPKFTADILEFADGILGIASAEVPVLPVLVGLALVFGWNVLGIYHVLAIELTGAVAHSLPSAADHVVEAPG